MAITERWKNHIADWEASGLSQAEYCRRHGLNANTFSGRLRDSKAQGLPCPPGTDPRPSAADGCGREAGRAVASAVSAGVAGGGVAAR